MTTNVNALTLRNTPCNPMDIEAQHTEAPQYNRNLARAKIATLAVASLAGAFTTAVIALHEGSGPGMAHHGRTLLSDECSQNQLNYINRAKRALIISGATAGACFGGSILGSCLIGSGVAVAESSDNAAAALVGCGSAGIGSLMLDFGKLGTVLGATATLISGIIYGVAKSKC